MELDMLGQLPSLRIHTQISFCFPLVESATPSEVIQTLRTGLERLSSSFPWAAGQVINEGADGNSSGVYKITGLDRSPRLIVRYLHDDPSASTWKELEQAEFPMRLLGEDIFAPRRTLPGGPGWSPSDPEPVFLLQANFIRGGLILTFNGQHAAMDMVGQAELIRLFSKACKAEAFTEQAIRVGNMPRSETVAPYDHSFQPGSEIESFLLPSDKGDPPFTAEATSSWAYFSFTPSSQAALKERARKDVTSSFVSSDDCLTAFIWQSATRVRVARIGISSPMKLFRAVDMRRSIGVPASYPGMLLCMATSKTTVQELIRQPLGVIASQLRAELDGPALVHQLRSLATYFSRNPDKSRTTLAATLTPIDFQLSSWAKVDCYGFDFGLGLGRPVAVRRLCFTLVESLMYLMPKRPDGEISAAICLRDEDLELLKKDPLFMEHARFIG